MLKAIIRASNRVWYATYYDELLEFPEFQISFLKEADRLYFNCAHLLNHYTEDTLTFIEKYFLDRNITPAIYLDDQSSPNLEKSLVQKGFQKIEAEQENWYALKASSTFIQQTQQEVQSFSDQNSSLQCFIFSPLTPTHYLAQFLELNASVNAINEHLLRKLKHNLLHPKQADIRFFCVLAIENGVTASSGLISLYKNLSFLSEGATHPNFRRRGIYTWLNKYCVLFSHAMYASHIVVNCDKEAYSNQTYQRLGFEFLGSRQFFLKNFST